MFGIMLQKMWHKRWMNLCLILGCILLVATVVSFPLYRNAAYNRMLQDEFNNYRATNGNWPGLNAMDIQSKNDQGGGTITKMENFTAGLSDELHVDAKENVLYYSVASAQYVSKIRGAGVGYIAIHLSGIQNVENKIKMISGECFSESGYDADGAIEVIMSQSCMIEKGLLVGEKLEADAFKLPNGEKATIVIKGVYEPENEDDYFWQFKPEDMTDSVLMNFNTLKELFTGENAGRYSLNCFYVSMFDYETIKASSVNYLYSKTKYFTEESAYRSVMAKPDYMEILENYNSKKSRIAETLIILQVPVLAMLAAFLLMISGQMYEMERNEISVIKSRGSSGGQIFRLYLYQGLVITIVGSAAGIPLGALFSRVLGATRNFLEFDVSNSLEVSYNKETFVYALVAMAVTLMSITLPAIKHSKVSIVNLKQQKALKKKPLWEKLFIDIIFIGVSLYGFYSFHRDMSGMTVSVLAGESLDPLLYISSSLFIVGLGLFFLRIQPYIIKVIYLVGKRFWGPASHVSFMENVKNGRKQHLIMLFLIMTISLGMFHATVARTILENAMANKDYLDGSDVVIQEVWTMMLDRTLKPTGEYMEPKYSKYSGMEAAKSFTKVVFDEKAVVGLGRGNNINATMMGIHTKQFGEITWVDRELLDEHYYKYLNALAAVENGILLSDNFKRKLNVSVGDTITVKNGDSKQITGKVVGFFAHWPGYKPEIISLNPDGTVEVSDNYYAITNYEYIKSKMGNIPYEVWIKLNDGYTSTDVYNWITENNLKVAKYINKADDLKATGEDPLLQGTNGVLTMGFVVTILLCAVGYLIYWVMSIRERELMFGVLRACGFHKSEVIHMLINEQIFSGFFSILAGIGIGKLTSVMFVPILQQAYASTDQVLPMKLITNTVDMYRLYGVIGAVMLISLFVLFVLVFRMNVTKALKLGEE